MVVPGETIGELWGVGVGQAEGKLMIPWSVEQSEDERWDKLQKDDEESTSMEGGCGCVLTVEVECCKWFIVETVVSVLSVEWVSSPDLSIMAGGNWIIFEVAVGDELHDADTAFDDDDDDDAKVMMLLSLLVEVASEVDGWRE